MTVLDAFMALPSRLQGVTADPTAVLAETVRFFGSAPPPEQQASVEAVVAAMLEAGIGQAVATAGMFGSDMLGHPEHGTDSAEDLLEACERYPEQLRAAPMIDSIPGIRTVCRRVEELAAHPLVVLFRVVPLLIQEPMNSRVFYPIYERCEALSLPVSINMGIPGPKVRAACQQAILVDDILIDFPDLVVIGAHMGHPWEDLLVRLMMKFENLYLCNSGYLAKYIQPEVVKFMNSSRGQGKLMFASDFPVLPFDRSLIEARRLPLKPEAMEAFLSGNCRRVLGWKEQPTAPADANRDG
jgi:uncharacterized protein